MNYTIDELKNIEIEDIAISTQALVCFCLDTSYSMQMNGKIGALNKCVRDFITASTNDIYKSNMINLCIVKFGGREAKVVQEFKRIDKIQFEDLKADGGTAMANGVTLALDEIEKEKAKWKERGLKTYKPILIVMSDGKSDEDLSEVVKRENHLVATNKIDAYCVGIGIENDLSAKKDLAKFCPKRKIETTDEFGINDFFERLSRSMTNLSKSFAGEMKGL